MYVRTSTISPPPLPTFWSRPLEAVGWIVSIPSILVSLFSPWSSYSLICSEHVVPLFGNLSCPMMSHPEKKSMSLWCPTSNLMVWSLLCFFLTTEHPLRTLLQPYFSSMSSLLLPPDLDICCTFCLRPYFVRYLYGLLSHHLHQFYVICDELLSDYPIENSFILNIQHSLSPYLAYCITPNVIYIIYITYILYNCI